MIYEFKIVKMMLKSWTNMACLCNSPLMLLLPVSSEWVDVNIMGLIYYAVK